MAWNSSESLKSEDMQMLAKASCSARRIPCSSVLIRLLNADMDMALDNVVPESLDWKHTDEGPE